jgi:hypothetical protein
MNYAELTQLLQDTVENEFTAGQLALFFLAAEERIYNAVQPPAIRRNQTATLSAGNPYLTLPSDFLYPFSLAVIDAGTYAFLLDKDVNFLREAYPAPATTGVPRFYALFDADTIMVAPTPTSAYTVELHYARYPESITTAGTSWLGDNFPTALMNVALVEAARFLKFEQDVTATYDKMAMESDRKSVV